MANEEIKENVRRLFDAFNRGDITTLENIISPDFVEHDDLGPGFPQTRAGLSQWLKSYRQSFPDVHFEVVDVGVDGDRAWVRGRVSGTHRAEFSGIPATGKSFHVEYMDELRFKNNLITEHWGQVDAMRMFQQLGVMQMSGAQS